MINDFVDVKFIKTTELPELNGENKSLCQMIYGEPNEETRAYMDVLGEWAKLEIENKNFERAIFLCKLKVMIKGLSERNTPMKTDGLACPVCGWNVVDREGNKADYCRHCGQRLE